MILLIFQDLTLVGSSAEETQAYKFYLFFV